METNGLEVLCIDNQWPSRSFVCRNEYVTSFNMVYVVMQIVNLLWLLWISCDCSTCCVWSTCCECSACCDCGRCCYCSTCCEFVLNKCMLSSCGRIMFGKSASTIEAFLIEFVALICWQDDSHIFKLKHKTFHITFVLFLQTKTLPLFRLLSIWKICDIVRTMS